MPPKNHIPSKNLHFIFWQDPETLFWLLTHTRVMEKKNIDFKNIDILCAEQ